MNNTQLYFAMGVPTFTVIVGILIQLWNGNRTEHRLSARMDRLEDRFSGDIKSLNSDIKSLRTELSAEIASLRDLLIGKVIEHGERIARLEHGK